MNKNKEETICPHCGEKENFHFNYDYSQKHMPIIDVLCNECGNFFEIQSGGGTQLIKNDGIINGLFLDSLLKLKLKKLHTRDENK